MGHSPLTKWSEKYLESNGIVFTVLVTIAVSVGGAVELLPPLLMSPQATVPPIAAVKPYSPLELAGRTVYIREGCYNCHSQMIRPFKWETERFAGSNYPEAPYSKAGEYVYDHPFQWGSKRTGPDLSRTATLKPNEDWHKRHLIDPQSTSPGSVMPAYAFLFKEGRSIDKDLLVGSMKAMNTLWKLNQGTEVGLPYSDADFAGVDAAIAGKTEGDALVAYLLKLGRDLKAN